MPTLRVVGGLFGLLGWLFFLGLQRVWHYTLGWVFKTLADLLDGISFNTGIFGHIRPFGSVAAWLRSLDRNVAHALARYADGLEHLAVWLFSRFGLAFSWIGREIKGLAGDVAALVTRLVKVYIPRAIRGLLRFVWKELRAVGRFARKQIPRLARRLLKFTRWASRRLLAGVKHLGVLWKWAKAVVRLHWRAIRGLLKRLLKLERKLVPKGFRKIVLGALGPLGLLWLMADTVRLLGTWLMRLDKGDVLEWVRDAFVFSIREETCVMQKIAVDAAVHVFEPIVRANISLSSWTCEGGSAGLPSGVTLSPAYAGSWEPTGTQAVGPFERLVPGVPLPRGVIKA